MFDILEQLRNDFTLEIDENFIPDRLNELPDKNKHVDNNVIKFLYLFINLSSFFKTCI